MRRLGIGIYIPLRSGKFLPSLSRVNMCKFLTILLGDCLGLYYEKQSFYDPSYLFLDRWDETHNFVILA